MRHKRWNTADKRVSYFCVSCFALFRAKHETQRVNIRTARLDANDDRVIFGAVGVGHARGVEGEPNLAGAVEQDAAA
jgi:hypothetical protein